MASVLTLTTALANSTSGSKFSGATVLAATGSDVDHRFVSIGTSEVEITISTDIGDAGACWIKNCDSTNCVQVGFATTVYSLRIPPTVSVLLYLEPATASLFLKANSAACMVSLVVMEA